MHGACPHSGAFLTSVAGPAYPHPHLHAPCANCGPALPHAPVQRVMKEMFDLPAVLRGRKPLSQLAGLMPLAGWLTTVGLSMGVTLINDRTMQQLQRSLYLRNLGVFARDMALRISAVIADISLQSAKQYFRVRVAYAWRQQLQDKLHDTYFRDMNYYRQTTWDNSIADPGQRITRDIGMLAFQLRVFCTSSVNESLSTIQTAIRIWFALPNERWLIPLIVAWSWLNLAIRNVIAPAIERESRQALSAFPVILPY